MRSRCASARIEARAVLPNHALAFGGFDVEPLATAVEVAS
jgi:hypothetical protein